MQINSSNLEILDTTDLENFINLDDLPIELVPKYNFMHSVSFTKRVQIVSDIIGLLAFEIKTATTLSQMQTILNNFINYFVNRVVLEIEESITLSEFLLLFCAYGDSRLIPDSDIICSFCIALFDQAHFLVYGQRIPEILPTLQIDLINKF